jgi:hypothetical protein
MLEFILQILLDYTLHYLSYGVFLCLLFQGILYGVHANTFRLNECIVVILLWPHFILEFIQELLNP